MLVSRSSCRLVLLPGLVVALLSLATPDEARADAQVSVRSAMGAGKQFSDFEDDVIFTSALRGESMFGRPAARTFRLGPAFELRTADFESLEGALGAGLLIPMPGGFPFGLTGLLGYAARKRAPDAPVAVGTLSWGYRGYNFHHWYGWGLNVFVSARRDLTGAQPVAEITGGIEVDVLFTTIIPALAIRNFFTGGDPDER